MRPLKQKQAQQAAEAAADEEQRVTRMRELAKEVAKEMDLFDKKGQPLSGGDREQAIAKTKADLQEFQNLMFAGKKWEVSDWLNFDSMKRKMRDTMEGAVTKAEVRDLFVADQSLAKLNERITTGMGQIKLDLFVSDPKILAGKSMQEQFHIAEQAFQRQPTGSPGRQASLPGPAGRLEPDQCLAEANHRQHGSPAGRCGRRMAGDQDRREHAHRRVRDHGQGRIGCGGQEIPRDQWNDLRRCGRATTN